MLLFYCGYYILDFSLGMLWWTTSNLWNSVVYIYKSNYTIEYKKEDDFVFLEKEDLKKEIIELKKLIKSTTRELNS